MRLEQTTGLLSVFINQTDINFIEETGLPILARGLNVRGLQTIMDRVIVRDTPANIDWNSSRTDIRDGYVGINCRAILEASGLIVYVPVQQVDGNFFSSQIPRSQIAVAQHLEGSAGQSGAQIAKQCLPETGVRVTYSPIQIGL